MREWSSKIWRAMRRRRGLDDDLGEEMRSHLELMIEENIAQGMPPQEARAAARRAFGNPTAARERAYEAWQFPGVETFLHDVRYAARVLRGSPGFTVVAVLSLALGIGANTAVFSVVHAVLLRPLPYPEPDRLVHLAQVGTGGAVSIPEYEFWKEHASSLVSAAGYRGMHERNLAYGSKHDWVTTMPVTADFFRTLGVRPALGREFNSEEARPSGPQAVILTDGLWRRLFDADPGVLGRAVTLDDAARYTVAGVLPRGFWFPQTADAFVPLRPTGSLSDMGMNTQMIARLKPGVSLRQADAERAGLAANMRRVYPDRLAPRYSGLAVTPFQNWLVGDVETNLLLLFGAVGLLLLIACSNLGGLLLARLAARQREIALRMALGSGRGRLLRQFLVENTLLTMAGGVAGLVGARAALDAFVALIPFDLPASAPIRLDAAVLVFTLAVAMGTGLVFSFAPSFAASRLDLQEVLKAGGRTGTGPTRQRVRSLLVVGEVGLSTTVLVAAALLIGSLYRIHQERLGFAPRDLITFWTPPERELRRDPAALRNFEAAVLERLRAVPGVHNVAAINLLPLAGQNNFPTERVGDPDHSIGGMEVRWITPGYFEAMGIPVVRGRPFLGTDAATAPPVILVNETVAHQWWPGGDPLGDRIKLGRYHGKDFPQIKDPPREVVGVVRDTKTVNLKDPPRPTVYLPIGQSRYDQGLNWVVRTDRSTGLAAQLRQAVAEIEPRQRVQRMRPMEQIVASTTADSRFNAWLFGMFAGLALLLTAIGVYGLLSFAVARRTHEIGTRMALGARRADVVWLVLRQGLALTSIGLVLGLAGALALTCSLRTLLFGVTPTDPLSFVGAAMLLLAAGGVASYLPARCAAKVDPMVALRAE